MDIKTIKAIRIVCGYTDDLRIKLPVMDHRNYSCYYNAILSLLEDERFSINLLGNSIIGMPIIVDPVKFPEMYDEKERILHRAACAVCNGTPYED